MEKEVLFFSRFMLDENGGGGMRREAQMADIMHPLNYRFLSCRDSNWFKNKKSRIDKMKLKLEKKFSPYSHFWIDDYFRDYVFKMRAVSREWIKDLNPSPGIELVMMDDPIYFYPLVEYFHKKKIPIVGLCQNIESLSLSQLNGKYQLELFDKEIGLLKKCNMVVTISREETFLLRNLNIPVYYLPYYPVRSIEKRMLDVRKRRESTKKEGFLMIGTAGNMVTLNGMTAFIDTWICNKNKVKNEKLLVAGYLTPKFLKIAPCENVDFLGELSNDRLDDILSSVKAMVCFQEFGSGALTKIREMIIAGVPVLATPHAARSYNEYKSVIKFSNMDDLEKAMSILETQGNSLVEETYKPSVSPEELVDKIKKLVDT
jgi:glycosyltransferase involved in cell wall biosynthesis